MDAQLINATTDLAALVPGLKRRGRYFIGPCPFCGGEDRFNIKRTDAGDLWICRKCGDGRYHDAVAFRMLAEGRSFGEVLREERAASGSDKGRARRPSPKADARQVELVEPPDEAWQLARLQLQKQLADDLWRPDAADDLAADTAHKLRQYLARVRGLSPDTIRRHMIGFNPVRREASDGIHYPQGIYIPCMVDGRLWYVKVRLPVEPKRPAARSGKGSPKYQALQGSVSALFNADALLRARVAVVVEGEFDAMLLGQFLPPDWAAVTMGSASLQPNATFLPYFNGLERVLLCLDSDEAGKNGQEAWRRLLGAAEPLPPLPGGVKDVTEFWRRGGDVAQWFRQYARAR